MAFRAPTHHATQRQRTQETNNEFALASPLSQNELQDSQEWILFSPVPPSATATADTNALVYTTSTGQTAGRSKLSEFGSLDTRVSVVRSYEYDGSEEITEGAYTEDAVELDEDAELDSLDSHLHDFHSQDPAAYHQSPFGQILNVQQGQEQANSVLPTHDGLGSFQLGGGGVQEQLYSFERHARRRPSMKKRRVSLDAARMEQEKEVEREAEKRRRIEEWRLEQSRAILEEVRKDTRRRRQGMAKRRTTLEDLHREEMATMGSLDDTLAREESMVDEQQQQQDERDGESLWTRITRRVIQDLMGIDDKLLSILFGESLPEDLEREMSAASASTTTIGPAPFTTQDNAWETRLLERIARELGLLVNNISEHPGAFSTYQRVMQAPIPYAGLPIIPEASPDNKEEVPVPVKMRPATPLFKPSMQSANFADPISGSRHYFDSEMDYTPNAVPVSNPLSQSTPLPAPSHAASEGTSSTYRGFTKEEWEKQLDIGLVFSYLRSRFIGRKLPQSPHKHSTTPQEAAARAARVRQHHPLVAGRPVPERRPSYKFTVQQSMVGNGVQRRKSSSCASQSTKFSASIKSVRSVRSRSSRCFWDIGAASLGSGSLVLSATGHGHGGGWGDV